jgi:NMD protein affecting ribosome stability and mRNA decay
MSAIEAQTGHLSEPTVCEHCGAIFIRRAWRRDRRLQLAIVSRGAGSFNTLRWMDMKPNIESTHFGSITIEGSVFEYDVILRLSGTESARPQSRAVVRHLQLRE